MNIPQSDSEDDEIHKSNNENFIYDSSSEDSDVYSNFDKEGTLVYNFKNANNDFIDFEGRKDSNFLKIAKLLIKYGFDKDKINEFSNKISHMNFEILKRQFEGNVTSKGTMYLRMANTFLKN